MIATLQKYSTPLITGLFLVSLISGIALFFHIGTQYFRGMHEWLSLVLVLPFFLHLWKNWRPFLAYFKRLPMVLSLAVSLAASLAFAFPVMSQSEGGGGNPLRGIALALETSTLAEIAPILGQTGDSLTAIVSKAGYTITGPDQTVDEIAKASGKEGFTLLGILVAARK